MGQTNGLVGGVTGKFGNIVTYYRRGKHLGRAYNPKTTNVKSRLQLQQRLRWKVLMALLRPTLPSLRIGMYLDHAGYELPYAMKKNMSAVVADNPNNYEITYTNLKFSEGHFDNIGTAGEATSASGSVTIPFTKDESYLSVLPADYIGGEAEMVITTVCKDTNKAKTTRITMAEITTNIVVNLGSDFVDEEVYIFGFIAVHPNRVLNDDQGIPCYCSETQYLASTTVE